MTYEKYQQLMHWAMMLRKLETDPIKSAWWVGYMRGLRRSYHGAAFGTEQEHSVWTRAAQTADDPARAASGRGYTVGLNDGLTGHAVNWPAE